MSLINILIAALVVGATGAVIGLLLGLADKKLGVPVDEREAEVRELLPGVNCGGCGYAGCDAFAKAIIDGEAYGTDCPVADTKAHQDIADVMGQSVEVLEKEVAYVKCAGTIERTKDKYEYDGVKDCNKAMLAPGGGQKVCNFGCLGFGSCVETCEFDALHIIDGIAVVDEDKCTGCSMCVAACPKVLIEMIPMTARTIVKCFSNDKGRDVKKGCSIGCIGCRLCVRACEYDAIHVKDNLAKIDYDKCVNCGECAKVCPVKVIEVQAV